MLAEDSSHTSQAEDGVGEEGRGTDRHLDNGGRQQVQIFQCVLLSLSPLRDV